MGKDAAPGPQEKRFAAYMEGLARAAGHADRVTPLQLYCMGLLLPGERKSVEPMAARLAPENVRRMHQSLHHVVADAPWSDEAVLAQVRSYALTALQQQAPVEAWIVDDTGFPKKGKHSVGVTRQSCGQVGKQDNCRVAVSLSVSTAKASLPIAWRLYLPQEWADDQDRRAKTGVPEEISFQTKPALALEQIQAAVEHDVPRAPVLAMPPMAPIRAAIQVYDSLFEIHLQGVNQILRGSGLLVSGLPVLVEHMVADMAIDHFRH